MSLVLGVHDLLGDLLGDTDTNWSLACHPDHVYNNHNHDQASVDNSRDSAPSKLQQVYF